MMTVTLALHTQERLSAPSTARTRSLLNKLPQAGSDGRTGGWLLAQHSRDGRPTKLLCRAPRTPAKISILVLLRFKTQL